jgi:hypothetical protein
MVSGRPPHRLVGTWLRPSMPPRISPTNSSSATTHSATSHQRQLRGQALSTVTADSTTTAMAGRHCSS